MFARPAHKRAARTLGYALTSDSPEAWHGLAFVLGARLSVAERGKLAFAALRSLEPDEREVTFQAAQFGEVGGGAGVPQPFGAFVMDDARWWAGLANTYERKAYALAAFEALAPADQAAFLSHVQGGARHAA